MVILILSVPLILIGACSFNILATPTHFVQELPEQSSIILQSVNIDLGSFLERTFHVYMGYTLSKPNDISYMSIGGLIITGIWEEAPLVTLQYSLNSTAECFHSWYRYFYSFLFLFLSISFLFCSSFQFNVVSICLYIVMK